LPENFGEKILQDKIDRGILKAEQVTDPAIRRELVDSYNESYRRVFIREALAALAARNASSATFMKYANEGNLEAAMLFLQRDIGDLAAVQLRRSVVVEVTRGR
jgi:hypothetical protein